MSDKLSDHQIEANEGAPLERNVTINLSQEQYERMFFQPDRPLHGDYAKRFANPTLLGLIGLLVPYTGTILSLLQIDGALPPYTLIGITGDYYFIGGICMILSGLCEFILGNSFPFAVFVAFGAHWCSLAYTQDPIHLTTEPFTDLGGPLGSAYQSSQGFHNVSMAILCFMIFIGAFRVNAIFVIFFFCIMMMFIFIATANFHTPSGNLNHVMALLKIAGGFGMVCVICGWYLFFGALCQAVGIPVPLPIFDLSSKVFPNYQERLRKEAAKTS
ncbi:hypothetical protein K470DRAFT_259834 [Piedraia hortae CBS 480.64]|uniref:GPR1/FUN34/YaaH-class plasma membrane protein n=1 Tax=Piedraia hortae CBS 480.64 TaxID=1314780 RepID=A0A6A7BVA1_9PEZI|nr:hypothetical protein K470DRAFT_259834 [Piedraia hortae CBS 480.64]